MFEPNRFDLNGTLTALGGNNSLVGTLTSRTLMFSELNAVLSAVSATTESGNLQHYRTLVIEENVCGKQSFSTRQKTFRHLRELYALDTGVPLFCIWKTLWEYAPEERPLLALLFASTREPLLRITASVILNAIPGSGITPQDFGKAVEFVLPGHYRPVVMASLGRNVASSWSQSGHLKGHSNKKRSRAVSGPASTAFAFLLSYLSEDRGLAMFDSLWVHLLDASSAEIDQFAFVATSRGWMDFRRISDVVDISFSRWKEFTASLPDKNGMVL